MESNTILENKWFHFSLVFIFAVLLVFRLMWGNCNERKVGRRLATLDSLMKIDLAIEIFYSKTSRLPDARDIYGDLCLTPIGNVGQVLINPYDEWKETRMLLDSWGKPFIYFPRNDGEFILYSSGPNGVDEKRSGDDIVLPWDTKNKSVQ